MSYIDVCMRVHICSSLNTAHCVKLIQSYSFIFIQTQKFINFCLGVCFSKCLLYLDGYIMLQSCLSCAIFLLFLIPLAWTSSAVGGGTCSFPASHT